MKRVVGIGAGGHAKVVLDVLQAMGEFDVVGFLDINPDLAGTSFCGVKVLGDDALLPALQEDGVSHAFIGVGGLVDVTIRKDIYDRLIEMGFDIVTAIHPKAVISPSAAFGSGVIIMPEVVVNADAEIRENVIVNTLAIVEHDSVVKAHAHIAPRAVLAGGVVVGEQSHIGIGAVVKEGVCIGEGVVVGAGAVVLNNVPAHTTVVGVPAKPI